MVDLAKTKNGGTIKTVIRKAFETSEVNNHTSLYFSFKKNTNEFELTETNYITLQCIKTAVKDSGKFGIKPDDTAMANIQSDMRKLCLSKHRIAGADVQLTAKEVGRRVVFLNANLARQLIAKEANKVRKELMASRLQHYIGLPDRDGYIHK